MKITAPLGCYANVASYYAIYAKQFGFYSNLKKKIIGKGKNYNNSYCSQ